MNVLLATLVLAATTSLVPINDLGPNPYRWGYYGGLWDVFNTGDERIPPDHLAGGLMQAAKIQPLDANGNPDPNGKIVFMAAGYNNTQRTFDSFMSMAAREPKINHDSLVFVNAAGENLDADEWQFDARPIYSRIDYETLAPAGVTAKQIQIVWLQLINQDPQLTLPIQTADAYVLKQEICETLRTMKRKFPNLQIAYLSDPQYAGYGTRNFLTEPFAYEEGFGVRWVITGQVVFNRQGEIWDPRIGNIGYTNGSAPWVTWGPYMWANGDEPRSDGLTWLRSDFVSDGNGLSDSGAAKAANLLLNFLLNEPTAKRWFLNEASQVPARRRAVRP